MARFAGFIAVLMLAQVLRFGLRAACAQPPRPNAYSGPPPAQISRAVPQPGGPPGAWPDSPPQQPATGRTPATAFQTPVPADQQPAAPNVPAETLGLGNEFELAQTVARVGDQFIFRGDLVSEANLILAPVLEKMPPEEIDRNLAQIKTEREQIVRQLLSGAVERKLLYLEFLRGVPPDKLEEAQSRIESRIRDTFQEAIDKMREQLDQKDPDQYQDLSRQDPQLYRLALAMKQNEMASLLDLEKYLRRYGSSLDRQREMFAERSLGQQKLRESIEIEPEVTHQEMLEYYRENVQEFEVPAQARWQQITVRFDQFSTKQEAGEAIARLGNELVLGGTPFRAVAERSSHGPNAEQGGLHDWTEWGDLEVSREINQAVFSLPIGELSRIIIDVDGLHIIEVLERREAHVVPFLEAQVDIKKEIQNRKRQESVARFLEKLRQRTDVWTIYDGQ